MKTNGLKDLRAPAFPDEPYSAYCKTCWNAVYSLWVDTEHHGGACQFGHQHAHECPDACGRAKFAADMQKLRDQVVIA